jgi:hypothetical protein
MRSLTDFYFSGEARAMLSVTARRELTLAFWQQERQTTTQAVSDFGYPFGRHPDEWAARWHREHPNGL